MMEFTYDGFVRWGFGFHNPNHAAAAICALEALAWAGLTGGIGRDKRGPSRWGLFIVLGLLVVAAVAGGVAGRFAPDAAALNRPKIWWAGLKLAAANPWGVGHGHSGLLASTFLLDGIEVRTLVNSHVTLLAEYGWIAGGVWIAFVVAALGGPRHVHASLWVAFAGLSVSAWMSSVFDWPVLLDWAEKGDLGGVNFTLSWILFVAYLVMGVLLVVRERRFVVAAVAAAALPAALLLVPTADVPKVRRGFVVKDGAEMPLVLHDAEWSLAAVLPYLETDGYRLAIEPGYQPCDMPAKSVWLFGTCAESAPRFTNAAVTVVSPPEFCILPPGARVVR